MNFRAELGQRISTFPRTAMASITSEVTGATELYDSPTCSPQSTPRSLRNQSQQDYGIDSPNEQVSGNCSVESVYKGDQTEQLKFAALRIKSKAMMGEETKHADLEVHEPQYYESTGTPYPKFYKRYIDTFGPKKGLEMYKAMRRWRDENDIDHIIDKPYPDFYKMKEGTPHFIFGKTKGGAYVSYELNGRVDPSQLSKAGVKAQDVEKHIAFNMELVREGLDHGIEKSYMTVMDLKGFSLLKASNFFFLTITRVYGETLHKYYAGVLERLVVVNPPFGAKAIFKILMAVLPGAFGEKVEILLDPSGLLEWIDADQLPVEYGGTNTTPPAESDVEKLITSHVDRVNRGN